MRKPWQTKEWREKRAEFIKGKSCCWCGSTEYLTISHPNPHYRRTYDEYMSFKDVTVLCRRCAFAYDKGMHLCQNCKKKYVPNQFDVCFDCLPSERKEAIKSRKEEEMKLSMEISEEEAEETRMEYCGNCEHHIENEGQELFCGLSPDVMCNHGLFEEDGIRRRA